MMKNLDEESLEDEYRKESWQYFGAKEETSP